jgi:hypothetical protein
MQAKKAEYNTDGSALTNYYFNALKTLLDQYKRPFTMMELFAKKGDLIFAIASNFKEAACIMISRRGSQELLNSCIKQNYENIILLSHRLLIGDIFKFSECEHIDVTFISDISKKFKDWKNAIDQILTLGDYIIIEAPSQSSKMYHSIIHYFEENNGELFAQPSPNIAAGELYLFKVFKKFLLRRRWEHPHKERIGEYTIESSFTEKKFIKDKKKPREVFRVTQWNSGINLYTFKTLNGIYPTHEMVRSLLNPLNTIQHNDLRIFNLIIQGNKLVPIDCDEDGRHDTVENALPDIINQFKRYISLESLYELDTKSLEDLDKTAHF